MANQSESKLKKGSKKCKRCGVKQGFKHFDRDGRREGGRVNVCRGCKNARQQEIKRQKRDGTYVPGPRGGAGAALLDKRRKTKTVLHASNNSSPAPTIERIALMLVPLIKEAVDDGVREKLTSMLNGHVD